MIVLILILLPLLFLGGTLYLRNILSITILQLISFLLTVPLIYYNYKYRLSIDHEQIYILVIYLCVLFVMVFYLFLVIVSTIPRNSSIMSSIVRTLKLNTIFEYKENLSLLHIVSLSGLPGTPLFILK